MDVHFKQEARGRFKQDAFKGFTLIELLITISIVAILLGVGLPSFVNFIDNNRVTSQANDLVYSFHMARSEAIKRSILGAFACEGGPQDRASIDASPSNVR